MKKSIIYSLLFIVLSGTMYSCSSHRSGNSAVDKRKKKMGKRKMKRTELGCPLKDC